MNQSRHPAPRPTRAGSAVLAAACALLSACEFGAVGLFDLPAPDELRTTVTLTSEDAAAAHALGWADGRIPGATVRLVPVDTSRNFSAELTTDERGTAIFDAVPVGGYRMEVRRVLTAEERAAAAASGAVAFVVAQNITVGTGSTGHDVVVPPSLRRSLVISEIRSTADIANSGLCCYGNSKFVELYNNADTTIYLDGKVIGMGFNIVYDLSPNRPCNLFTHLRIDPLGIWALQMEQFPGSGRDYPLAPGETVVVARDAIDHRPFAPTALDLSHAQFEFFGIADVDNPQVPNMINIGLQSTDRGLSLTEGVLFVASPVDVSQLVRGHEPDTRREWMRVPAERLLDVAMHVYEDPTYPLCGQVIHPSFDRGHAVVHDGPADMSRHRRPLMTLPDGRVILQHTRTSFADFMTAAQAPGTVLRP
jgi:hypothetical protein